jgi:dihydropteroate synthase
MRAACAAGATLINDVRALREPGAIACARMIGAAVCLMHMQGEPQTMQLNPHYVDVTAEVCDFLQGRVRACVDGGIPADRILVDPGFGFGKTLDHNLALLGNLDRFPALGAPLLIGVSRKSMLGALVGDAAQNRLSAGLAAAAIAAWQGAKVVRTHDVRPTVEVLRTIAAVLPRRH